MEKTIIALAGVILLLCSSFMAAFYADFRKRQKLRKRKRQMREAINNNRDMRRDMLKIPGYYEEITNRSKKENLNITNTTIL